MAWENPQMQIKANKTKVIDFFIYLCFKDVLFTILPQNYKIKGLQQKLFLSFLNIAKGKPPQSEAVFP